MIGKRLASVTITPEHAGTVGAPILFESGALKQALIEALNQGKQSFNFLVKRSVEDVERVEGYYIRPADNSHQHSSGHHNWRPALVVDLL